MKRVSNRKLRRAKSIQSHGFRSRRPRPLGISLARFSSVVAMAGALFASLGGSAQAVTGSWILDGSSNWTGVPANWTGGVIPNGIDDEAIFRNDIIATRTITLNEAITLKNLSVGDALGISSFVFAGANALTFQATTGNASINKYNSVTDTWQAPLVLTSNLNANIYSGALDVNAGGAQVSYTGAGDTIKNGAGTLQLNISGAYTGNFAVNFGTLRLGGANSPTPTVLGTGPNGIVLNGTGRSDLAILSLNNNGSNVNNSDIVYGGSNDVVVQGGATINVDRHYTGTAGTGTGLYVVLDNLTMNGGIFRATSGNSYRLAINNSTMLVGDTNVFIAEANTTSNFANITLRGVIDDGVQSRALIKEGAGRMIVLANNTYDGPTAIKDGVLQVGPGAGAATSAAFTDSSVFVNGGALGLTNANQVSDGVTFQGGLNLVSQIGTSRASLATVVNTGFVIDAGSPLSVNVPIYGMALAVDTIANNINLSNVGGADSSRVYLSNRTNFDSTYTGIVAPAIDGTIRLASSSNNLILSAANQLGDVGSTAKVAVGLDMATSTLFAGGPSISLGGGTGGTVSVRANNPSTLGAVTVHRGVTLNINGTITTPLGANTVTALGGTINTDNASAAQFGNTDFRLYGGSTLLLDNRAVTAASTNRRLLPTTDIRSTSSTLSFAADGAAAGSGIQAQTIDEYRYSGGNTINIGRDAAVAGTRADLTITQGLTRENRGTVVLQQLDAQAATLGTASATSKIILTAAPTLTNGMAGADVALLGGANMQDTALPSFVTHDVANGLQAAAFGVTATSITQLNTSVAATILDINGITGTNTLTANVNAQAVRLRTTAASQILANGGFNLNIGTTAAVGQGAGLYLVHTSNDTVPHTANFAFGAQEGVIYTATTGGTAGIVQLGGVLSGTNGITRFGPGILRLTGANTFTGNLTINSGETRLNGVSAGGLVTGPTNTVDLWGGAFYLEAANTRYNNNIAFSNDARFGNVNVGGTGFNNLIVNARSGSTAPIVMDIRHNGGNNATVGYGSVILNGPAQAYVSNLFQTNGAISGTGTFEKFGNERWYLGGDSSGYAQTVTVHTGFLGSLNASPTAKPFGTGNVVLNPGGSIRLAAAGNINAGQLTVNSDFGGIAGIGLSYVGNPASLPTINFNQTAPWRAYLGIGAVGFSQNINQGTLWGGSVYLGAQLGETGVYTGTLTGDNSSFLLGTGQGTIRIASPLTGANSAIIGVSMTGDGGRANQTVNNSGGTVQYDVPMTYTGDTIINTNGSLRISATNAITGLGAITLNGGILQPDNVVGQLRMIAPLKITNDINLAGDSTIQMQNNPTDVRITGAVNLANGSTGVVRQLNFGTDQLGAAANNAGVVYLDGGISNGTNSASGNHWIKSGPGLVVLSGPQTFTGSTTVSGGFVAIDGDADLASSSQIVLAGGGIGIYEKSFTTDRNMSFHGGNGTIDVAHGLTLTQSVNSTYDGTSALIKRGMGTLILNGNNAFGAIVAADGVLQVNSQAALGNPTLSGVGDIQFGGDFNVGGANNNTRYTGGTLRINGSFATNRGLQFNNNGNTNFGGGIDVTPGNTFVVNGVVTQGTEFDYAFKTGSGTIIVNSNTSSSTFTPTNGGTNVTTGNTNGLTAGMRVTGAGIPAGATIAAIVNNTTFTLSANATAGTATTLTFVNDNTVRNLAVTGGVYQFANSAPWTNGTATAADNTNIEILGGAIRAVNTTANIALANLASTTNYNYGGGGRIRMESGAGFSVELAADNLVRVNQGTLVIEALGGTTLGGVGNINTGRLLTTNAINSGLARASALTNGIFAPHLLTADATGVASFTTSDAATGIVAYAGATVSTLSALAPNAIGDISTVQNLSGVNSIYAFRTTANVNGGTLVIPAVDNVREGGILINGSNTISSNLIFDPSSATAPGTGTLGEGLVYVKAGENAAMTGSVTSNAFTKFGGGTLTLGSASVLSDLSVQEGTLKIGAGGLTSRMNTELNVNAGATLDLNGNSITVETLGSNNRLVATAAVGGSVTNSGPVATLEVGSPTTGTYTGTLNGTLKLQKSGVGVLNIDGFRTSTPEAGNNTFTGGTDIYGFNLAGGINLDNASFGLGGFGTTTQPEVNLYSGTLGLLASNTFTAINGTHGQLFNNQVVKFGSETGLGLTLNVRGPGQVNVNQSSVSLTGQGNLMQVGALNMTDTTLNLSGGNFYRMRVAGTTTIQGSQAAFQTNSDGPSGALELAGKVTGAGALTKLGDASVRGIILSNPTNDYSGGTNIVAGDVQVTSLTNALGTGKVRVFAEGTLRIAGNNSVIGSNLEVYSRAGALGAVSLDENFNPTVLTASNFASVYNTTLQLSQPYFTQPLNLSAIGDGRTFLGSGLAAEVKYMAPTLGAGVADDWNPGVGVYRLVGGVNNFGFDGVNNVLTGNNYLQVGPQRNNIFGAITNTGNSVVVRNSNNYSGGTQITAGTGLVAEIGGSPIGETPFGSGAIEVYGTLTYQSSLGSNWKADTGTATNAIVLRPGGVINLTDGNTQNTGGNLVAGGQGRWGDAVGIDLNGGTIRLNGSINTDSVETIGDVIVRKGGTLSVVRNAAGASAQFNVGTLTRVAGGTLSVTHTAANLGNNVTTPLIFERLTTTSTVPLAGTTTNGAGAAGGIAPVWMVDATENSFLSYTANGFQPLQGTAPGAGQVAYNQIISATTVGALSTTDTVDFTTAAKTMTANTSIYALRLGQSLAPAAGSTLTIASGGLISTGTPTLGLFTTNGAVTPMTVNFGTGGNGEAVIFNAGVMTNYAQINAALGLTKFGASNLDIRSINPGIGDDVTINAGIVIARVPFSGSGAAVGQVFNSQDVILNGGTLQLDPFISNAAGTATEIASGIRATALFNSDIYVRGNASLNNNGQAQYVRIQDLTFENGGGAAAMNGNGVINLALQNGIWVSGTTTLIPQATFNMTLNNFAQSTFSGQVTQNGVSDLQKYGNGTMTFLNGTNNYTGGTTIWGSTTATTSSAVASAFRGTGTPFGTGDVEIQPGGLLRVADNANIASNAVYLRSDGYGLGGLGIAHNGVLPAIITSGTPTAGQVKVESTGNFAGVIALDYGYYSRPLNMAAIPGGAWWLGNSQQNDAYYFNSTLGTATGGKYLLGGGGTGGSIQFGSVLVSANRTSLFENVFSGGTANQVKVEIGAQTADFAWNSPSYVNGASGYVAMTTRNTGLVGDVRVNTNTTLGLGNNFALGSGRLIVNGGTVRFDIGNNNFIGADVAIDNNVVLQGDLNVNAGNGVFRGGVAMSDVAGAGATRNWNISGGTLGVRGVVSGAEGSNLLKIGAGTLILTGENSYKGFTQLTVGNLYFGGDVIPNQDGPLGNSASPVVVGGGILRAVSKLSFDRDMHVNASATFDTSIAERVLVNGGISLGSTFTLTVGAAAGDVTTFRGGLLQFNGPISGAGALSIGTTAVAPAIGGTVLFSANSNGYATNTYSGGTTIQSARVQLSGNSYFTGPAGAPTTILSGPLGIGTITIAGGETNRGAIFEAVGGPVTIVNALAALSTAANTSVSFGGHEALAFTRALDVNSDATLRNRTFTVQNMHQPVTFSGILSATGAAGVNLIKTGPGLLILNGANTFATSSTQGLQITQGTVRINTDASLGAGTTVRLNGGVLSTSETISTARQMLLQANGSGIDVAPTKTLTLTAATSGAFSLFKTGNGTLALDNNANTNTALIIGGQAQLNPNAAYFNHTGGTVSTIATSGTPFGVYGSQALTGAGTAATTAGSTTINVSSTTGVFPGMLLIGAGVPEGAYVVSVTSGTALVINTPATVTAGSVAFTARGLAAVNGGTLSLVGGPTAQALSVPALAYGAAGQIALNQGSTSSQLTVANVFARAGSFNSNSYGTLTVVPSSLANLGTTEKLIITTGAPANTATGGGEILTVPSIFVRAQASADANFARYNATGSAGVMVHNVATVATLAASAPTNVADITVADVAGAGNIDVQALRTSANITPDISGTTLIRLARGGLIINGATASTLSAPVLFGTGAGASLTEGIVYVRDGQTGTSAITGGITARDLTKTGPGTLQIGGTGNLLNSNGLRLPVVSVQDGVLKFANTAAQFQNQLRGTTLGDYLGHYALNVNEAGVLDLNGLTITAGALTGNGTISSNVAGAANLTVKNGFGVDTTFNGGLTNGAGTVSLTKTQNGVLTLSGYSTHTGGTTIQAGRVLTANATANALGRLEATTVEALGAGPVTLQGGTLRLNAAPLLGGAQNLSESSANLEYLQWGGGSGLNINISGTGISNGVALPQNRTSTLNAVTRTAGINNLNIDAPVLTFTEGTYHVTGTTTLSQDNTVLRLAGGTVYLAGKVDADGETITKVGANTLVLSNGALGADQNDVGTWKVYGGILQLRTAEGASNPLGSSATVELNTGSTNNGLQLLTDGDGTGIGQRVTTYADTNVRFGSSLPVSSNDFVAASASRVTVDRAQLANSSFKTVEINNLEVMGSLGGAFAYFVLGNNDSMWVDGTTTFQRDLRIQIDGGQGLTLNGLVSGNGTFSRHSNGGSLYFNADNSSGYSGGTFFTGGGRNYLGSMEGNQVKLSDTAKLGAGHVFLGPLALFQINSAGNLQANQNIYVSGNIAFMANFSLAADLTLDQIQLRSLGLGGIQNSATDYYLSATNPSSAVLSLGTVYTKPLNLGTMGDGMWYLGSATNGVGANGAYDAATLGAGLGNTYRLGSGGNTLFLGTNGNANVLTGSANLVVGTPMTVQNFAPVSSGTGTVVLLQNQNYTGSTLVNTGSTLDFRGTMQTSGFDVRGTLNVAGETGTFLKGGANIPVTLRPGSTLRFDNTSAGVLPTSATQGRWEDSVGIALNDSVLRLQGNSAVEVTETVGAITANDGGNRIEVIRGVAGRGVELRTPSIARGVGGFGTVQFLHNGSQLGSDERVMITGTAPTVINGMVAPWMVSNTDSQFLTYNADTGFVDAGFDRIQAAATLASATGTLTERTFASGVPVLNGADLNAYALRTDVDINLNTASAATDTTNRVILGSGGLLVNGARTIQTGIWAGAAGDAELVLFNNNTLNVGILANNTTSGRIKASSITKFGAGTLQILSEQPNFSGDIRVQQGVLQFGWTGTSAANINSVMGGNGGNIILQGNNTQLLLRIGNDTWTAPGGTFTFNNSVVIGDNVSVAQINYDRNGGSITGKRMIFNNLTFGDNTGDNGQVLRLVDVTNDAYSIQFNGVTTLKGRSAFSVENNYSGGANDAFLMGKVTGTGMLIKGPSDSKTRTLFIQNVNSLNDWSGGTVLQGGTLQVQARAVNGASNTSSNIVLGGVGSASSITVMGGTLDLRMDSGNGATPGTGAADTDIEFVRYTSGAGVGLDLNVNGSTTINTDRNSYQGTYTRTAGVVTATLPGGHGFVNGQTVTVTTGANANNFVITSIIDANTFTYADATGTAVQGFFAVNNGSGSNKMLTFNNMTIGTQVLNTTAGNGYGLAVAGTTNLQGNAYFNTAADLVLGGGAGATGTANSIISGGGQVSINKIGIGTLWVHSTNNLTGPTYINAGRLDFGNRAVANNTATLGIGNIYINPGAEINVRATTNINSALGQRVVLTSTSSSPAVFLAASNTYTQAQYKDMIAASTPTSNENMIIAFGNAAAIALNLDQSDMGNGRVFFGANTAMAYNGVGTGSIIPGLANLPESISGGTSTNRVYRLGGRNSGVAMTIDLAGTGNLNDVGGATDVQIGSQANLGPSANWGLGQVVFSDQNTYTGQTIISRGSTLRFNQGSNAGGTAGPLGANGANAIHAYGILQAEGATSPAQGTFVNATNTGNAYTNVILHPGSSLIFLNNGAAISGTNTNNRWEDFTAIKLDGARLTLDAANNIDLANETVGPITFDRGARIQTVNEGTSEIILNAASITRAGASTGAGTGRGTMVFTPVSSANFGLPSTTNNAEQVKFATDPTVAYPTTSAITNLLPGFFIEGTAHRFVTYNIANGVTPVADGSMVAFSSGMTAGTAVVNAAAVTLPDYNPFIYALRASGNINSPTGANNDATITFGGTGADIGALVLINGGGDNTSVIINPNLTFGASGGNEALIYFTNPGGTNRTAAISGNITANGITKFGSGQLNITNDQSDAARGTGNGYSNGWVINEGSINLQTFGSAGNAVASNTIVLNGNQVTTPTLFLRATSADDLQNYTYTSGRVIAVDNAVIDWDAAASDRVHKMADIEIQQSGGIGNATANGSNDALLRVAIGQSRTILAAGQLIVTNNAILNVDSTSGATPFFGSSGASTYLTNGVSAGMSVSSLTGSQRLTKWGDGYLYVRGASPTFSGPVVIDQGAVYVSHNQSLGTGALTVNRYGTLDIGVTNFVPTNSSVTYNEGSIERWSVDSPRSGTLNLGKATLQVAANQPTTNVAVTMNGGSIEGWLRNDDQVGATTSAGVMRVLNSNVTFNLAGDSYLGAQYYLGANGLDIGKQGADSRPLEEYLASGVVLDIKGVISGVGGLTKTGYDTVFLSGSNTYQGATKVEGGKLMIGKDNALPVTTTLTTTANGVLDLNGQNQMVGRLTNPVIAAAPNVTSGFITNSSMSVKTLTVGNGAVTDATYSGIIQHNVGLTKMGTNQQTLTNNNTFTGPTRVQGGTLNLSGSINGTSNVQVDNSGTLLLSGTSGNQVNDAASVNLNGGTLAFSNVANQTETLGSLTLSATSVIDFGASGGADQFLFQGGLFDHTAGTLNIVNWSGFSSGFGLGISGTDDRLLFNGNMDDFTTRFGQAEVSFNGISGYTAIGYVGGYEIVPVPEPSSTALLGSAALLALVGYRERRRLRSAMQRKSQDS